MDAQLLLSAPARPVLELDLIADFTCPWSYLGKRSLERALGSLYGASVRNLRWHGFPLQRPKAWRDFMASRLPPGVRVEVAERALTDAGRELGIAFDFAQLKRLPDTHEAHRLVKLAAREDRQSEVAEALFAAYFEHGRDIGDPRVLADIGRESLLSEAILASFENPEEGRDEVVAEEQRLRGLGVIATPNVLINGRILVPGPADVSTYVTALDQALFPELPVPKNKRHLH